MVPVVGAEGGRWPLAGALAPMLKPGGHGAIWKLMLDEGVFAWLAAHRREGALVRQIRWPPPLWPAHVVACKCPACNAGSCPHLFRLCGGQESSQLTCPGVPPAATLWRARIARCWH